MHPNPESAFNYALSEIKKYKEHPTPELSKKALLICKEVADAYHDTNIKQQEYLKHLEKTLSNAK